MRPWTQVGVIWKSFFLILEDDLLAFTSRWI
jgi:hypothetical protein